MAYYSNDDGRLTCRVCGTQAARTFVSHSMCSTCSVRKYRANPENRERDNEASRRWKESNRERNRARDREYRRKRRVAAMGDGLREDGER